MVPEEMSRRVGRRALLRTSALGGAGLAAVALIGCGSDDEGDSGASGGPSAGATTVAAQLDGVDVGGKRIPYNFPEPAGKTPKAGGTLVVGTTWEASTIDPTKSAAGGTITIPNTVYNRLIGFKKGVDASPFKYEIVPELAQSWEVTPDGLTATFTIKPGIKWQNIAPLNGRPFVASDVRAAYERYAKDGVHKAYFSNMKSVEAPNDSTLKITLNKPQPDFVIPLAGRYLTIHPKELVDAGEIDRKAVGTGPMILKDMKSTQVAFSKNPDYFDGKVLLDGMEYRTMIDGAAQLAAFRAGQIDFGYIVGTNATDLEQMLKTNPEIQTTVGAQTYSTFAISFNLDNPKYQDVRIRRAVSLAMDRKEIEQVVMAGYAVTMPTIAWNFLFDKAPTADSGLLGKWWRTDRTEAKALLVAAGQENLELEMIFNNYSDTSNSRPNEVLVNQMRQAGIKFAAKRVDYTEFNSQWVSAKFADLADGWLTVGFDADNFFYAHVRSDSPGNRWRIKDAEIDAWADQQRSELNKDRRKEVHRKIWDKVLDQAYRVEKPTAMAFATYQPWLRGYRSVGALGTDTYYYDWGAQAKNIWLDK
ncbi:MAG: ABC transporter substrate-binding protein [Chloroflexi bacterium]|nr:ABC transporter substrate-binding protein [Chloroflexota bacterium]